MRRTLFLTARVPAPLDDGWKIRTFHLIKGYARNGFQVHLLSFGGGEQHAEDFPELQSLCSRVQLIPRTKSYSPLDLLRGLILPSPFHIYNYRVRKMADAIRECHPPSYDLIQIEDIVMAQYLGKTMDRTVRILDMHNVESDLLRRYAGREANPFKRMYARLTASKLERYERNAAGYFHQILVCSREDRRLLLRNGIRTAVQVVPNGVDCEYLQPPARDEGTNDLVFVGSMDYHANISGVAHFVRRILPLIWEEYPEIRFFIVGKNPPDAVRDLAGERIVVTGKVPDVRPYLASARVVVVPLLVGGGTRLKILESMAMGKPIVSTSLGAEGIPARDGEHLLLADEPADFAERVRSLLDDHDKGRSMGQGARRFVEQHFDWASVTRSLCHDLPNLKGEG